MSRRRPISPKTALVQDVAYEHGKDVLSLHCTETGEVWPWNALAVGE